MNFDTPGPPASSGAHPTPYGPPMTVADLETPVPPRRRHPGRWVAAFVAAGAIAIGAIVATGGTTTKSPVTVLADASGNTTRAGTARVSMVETINTGGRTLEILDIRGARDFDNLRGSMTMASQGRTVLSIIQVGDATFMSSPLVSLPDGAQWVSATASDLKVTGGQSPVGSNDPTQGLKYLSAIDGDPKEVGHDTVDGVDTTHYTFTIDMTAYLKSVAKADKALGVSGAGSSFDALAGVVDLSKLPSAAWIDSEGRVRRFTLTIDASQDGQTAKVVDTMSFSHFDEPVSIAAPPKSATLTFSQFPDFLSRLSAAGTSISS